ncbi:dethiobiotin synthetase [Anaerosolibacter carboniphilus]|uniref:ATP-dependent dethiobiotin synthetase BioD n=1 Tax=Anaerosolibacter carboniphilus TaxID=1417629 RepID=A0A841KUZ6_9FIRM|nr:dethiobiotin synthase [Anaerosolibacter carboniphilus]MBB6217217.1 dethiobiotin synthetase [Anaerosolibacter carboniphilus]
MAKGIFIVGTDTDVGKSVITAGLVYLLRKNGYRGVSYKAVQSGGIEEDGRLISADARFVNLVAGLEEDQENINGYCLRTPVSPHLAAKLEGVKLEKAVILKKYQALCKKYDYVIAEGSGGLVVPLIDEAYMVYDFIKELDLPLLVVARTGVGTINHTVLTVKHARQMGLEVKAIVMNGYRGSIAEEDNIKMVERLTGVPVLGVIDQLEYIDVEKGSYGNLKEEFERKMDIQVLLESMADTKDVIKDE